MKARGIAGTVFALSLVASGALAGAQGKPSAYTEKDVVWVEDFNGKKINKKDWNFEFHEPGWVNAELQSYDDSKENTYLKDGCLVIQAIKKDGKDGKSAYTSGRINTQGKHAFKYGRFESRLRVPKGKGFLPAFWMMPDDESYYGQWPKCGEIDIMEVLGDDISKLYGTIHFGEPHGMVQGTHTLGEGNFSDEFHTFAVEWEPGEIRWYCDGVNYKTANDWFTKRPGFGEQTYPAPFDQPFYVILNVAVGGSWVGYPDETTDFDPAKDDAKMYVDYVKVYQKKSYDENVERPERAPVVAVVDSTGNMLKQNAGSWEFLTAGGGKGSVKGDGKSHDIITDEAGSLEYSIQYVQPHVALNKGCTYRYSFDASADEARTIITGISAPNSSYARRFGDVKVELTPQNRHFSFDFTMDAEDDSECRLEYNCGAQGSKAAVHISNVRLEKIKDAAPLTGRQSLPDGNYIENGQFQEGKGRLGGWASVNNAGAKISVTGGRARMLSVASPAKTAADGVKLVQKGIPLVRGKNYVVKFDAALDASTAKKAEIAVKCGSFERTAALKGVKKDKKSGEAQLAHFEWTYTPEENADADFELLLGTDKGTVFVDNVVIKENCVLHNGSFESGKSGWELYANESSSASFDVVKKDGIPSAAVSISETGPMDWMIQLKQTGRLLEKGKTYTMKLSAECDIERSIMLAMQRDGAKDDDWFPYSGTQVFNVGPGRKDYSWEFTMPRATDENVIFTISMGAVAGKKISSNHTVSISAISVEEVAE